MGGGSLIFVSGQGPIEAGGATVDGDDTGRLREMVQARRRHLPEGGPAPTTTAVVVSALAVPGMLIEVEAVAAT